MPELPEVETVRRTLEKCLAGLSFTGVVVNLTKVIRTPILDEFSALISDKKIIKLDRKGKYLLIHLAGGHTLVVHLRMTGRLIYSAAGEPVLKHTHVIFLLSNGDQLRFTDIRQFGRMSLVATDKLDELPGYKDLGVDPTGKNFSREFMKRELRRRRTRLKTLLLDQTFVAGLGNIYVDEALHRARLHPERLAFDLNPREITRLFHAIKDVITEGIENRGTSFRDYVDGEGQAGNYQNLLRVYNRENQPCHHCETPISRIRVSGRSSYFCPNCQKA